LLYKQTAFVLTECPHEITGDDLFLVCFLGTTFTDLLDFLGHKEFLNFV